jgi:amino acid transporter
MSIKSPDGTNILKRQMEYTPPRSWRTWLMGRPLSTADAPHQTIGKVIGLAVFASDALSSTAYGPQEMMAILVFAGVGALQYAIPLSIAIVILLAILTISYEQTIHAYPGGGGAYIVARDNLGTRPALIAAGALLMDYILTVSVSISSGVAQIVSAFPDLYNFRVQIAVFFVLFVMLVNLRGVRESGTTFAIPTYYFVFMMYLTVIVGLFRYFTGTLGTVVDPPPIENAGVVQPLTMFLILRAFANGTAALTGVEAISNGITAFKEPRSVNAGKTLVIMSVILGSLMLGITFLAVQIQAIPSETETIISQIGRTVFDSRGLLYLAMISSTAVILIMAANTAFADFPRLSALVAVDGFLPRQLAFRGSRLVYSYGIVALALIASFLIVIFNASVTNLIPLYAIGVFLSFSLSQGGMARRWWKSGKLSPDEELKERGSTLRYEKSWLTKMIINSVGCVTTIIVVLIFGITKFLDGAWIIILIIPILVFTFLAIHKHYSRVARKLSLDNFGAPPPMVRRRVILTAAGVHRGTLEALRYARTISDDITALHVSIDPDESNRLAEKWKKWGDGVRLVILESPYRLFIEPLLGYIHEMDKLRKPNEALIIIVPQFVSRHWWNNLLHTRTADTLRKSLLNQQNIIITEVPYQVEEDDRSKE